MRVGIIGCGYWGSKHLRVLQGLPEVKQVVAIDASPQRRQSIAAAFREVSILPSLSEALPHIDAAVVATPPETHVALGTTLLHAGKHVLIEKPLATSVRGARSLVDAAQQRDLTLMVGHTFEYNPAVRALRELVSSGELGAVYHLHSERLNLGLYQADVDVFWDLAPHDISIANTLLAARPSVVRAWGGRCAHERLHDVGYVYLDYEELGVAAQLHVSWLEPRKIRRVTVVGSSKMAIYDDLADDDRLRIYDRGVDVMAPAPGDAGETQSIPPVTYRNGAIVSPYVPFDEPLALEDRHFVKCATTGDRPVSDGRSGLAVVATLEAVARSLAEDRAVAVECDIEEPV
jgi:predicted dehydrogenase